MVSVIFNATDLDEYDLDELDSGDVDLINDLEVATGSNADPTDTVINQDFQVVVLLALGLIIGILLVGSRRFKHD